MWEDCERSWASLRCNCGTVTLTGNTTGSLGDKLDEDHSTSGRSLEGEERYSYSRDGSLLLRVPQGGTIALGVPRSPEHREKPPSGAISLCRVESAVLKNVPKS